MLVWHEGSSEVGPVILVAPGSTQRHFPLSHPWVQTLLRHSSQLACLELPGHGLDSPNLYAITRVEDALEQIRQDLLTLPPAPLLIAGYSLGALVTLKHWSLLEERHPSVHELVVGMGLRFRSKPLELVRSFFQGETFEALGWRTAMEHHHGPRWLDLVETVGQWFNPGSTLFLTSEEVDHLTQAQDRLVFVVGNEDQTFDSSDISSLGEFTIIEVPGDHFSYFSRRNSWADVQDITLRALAWWGLMEDSPQH